MTYRFMGFITYSPPYMGINRYGQYWFSSLQEVTLGVCTSYIFRWKGWATIPPILVLVSRFPVLVSILFVYGVKLFVRTIYCWFLPISWSLGLLVLCFKSCCFNMSGSRTPTRTFEFGRTHVVRPKGNHQATIVWLHGLGDKGSRY